MKNSKLAASLIAVSLAATTLLTGCNNNGNNNSTPNSGAGTSDNNSGTPGGEDNTPSLPYAPGTTIRIAAGYNKNDTGITFVADTISAKGENGSLKLPDGVSYSAGMLKPTWQAISDILDIKFTDKYAGNSASAEWANWKDQLGEVDIVAGTAANDLNPAGTAGKLVDLSKYLDSMPNFKAYLDDNPIVRLSITGYTTDGKLGAIYFAPYFDGVDDIERMPLMRTDWVEKLLNGEGEFTADGSNNTANPVYQPYMPTSGSVSVDVVKKDASGTEKVTKNYDAEGGGNIIAQMNAKGSMTGIEAVNMLRKYIDVTYGGYYGNDRADLFIGQNAAYDADELVALLRCVVANPQTLNGTTTIQGIFSRADSDNQRRVDTYRLGAILFGARGLESRQEFLYVGNDKKMHDARQEPATYEMLERMNQLVKENLIATSYVKKEAVTSEMMLKDDLGFMSYDYNQTQTAYNEQEGVMGDGEMYRAVMIPVAKWYDDGTDTPKYMRFTESWRSVKDSGWAIPASTESNTDVLNACLTLFDYAFSPEGQILMSYGPDAFIKVKDASVKVNTMDDISKKYTTFDFNGTQMPEISDATYEALWKLEGGNYTNFARRYLGSTLHFVKSQAFEVQCTTEAGKEGAAILSNAIAAGIIYHPVLSTSVSNPWYISVPTVFPPTDTDQAAFSAMEELNKTFSTGSKDTSVYCEMIVSGYAANNAPGTSAEACVNTVVNDWRGKSYLEIKNAEWDDILNF